MHVIIKVWLAQRHCPWQMCQYNVWSVHDQYHPVRRKFNSDWFVNGVKMVACENYFCSVRIWSPKMINFSQATIMELFTNQSELDILPLGWNMTSLSIPYISAWELLLLSSRCVVTLKPDAMWNKGLPHPWKFITKQASTHLCAMTFKKSTQCKFNVVSHLNFHKPTDIIPYS